MAPPCCCARAWMEASVSAAWGRATACRGEYGHGESARWRGAVAMRAEREGGGGGGARLAPAYAKHVAHDLALVEGVLGARGVLAVDEGDEAAVPRAQPLLLGARPHDLRSRDYSATTSTGSPQATGHMAAALLVGLISGAQRCFARLYGGVVARHKHSGRRVPRNAHPIMEVINAGITRRRGGCVCRQHTLTDWTGPKSQNCL